MSTAGSDRIERVRRDVEELASEFEVVFGLETIWRCAGEALNCYKGARVQECVPLLVHKLT